jgi:hypothetical protein
MSFRHVTRFSVEFGDCDPAKIMFYPNFFRWLVAASLHFCMVACRSRCRVGQGRQRLEDAKALIKKNGG